jgi:cytochrome c-type biogenesis protein CcsB
MINSSIEILLNNTALLCLFVMMVVYWVQASFLLIPKFNIVGYLGVLVANLTLFFALILRWVNSGYFPLSNLYESLLFLAWSLTFFEILFEKLTKNIFIGVIIIPMALFTLSFANFSLPKEMQKVTALVPALQSNWLMMHVTIMILSYAALLCGSLLAITFLFITEYKNFNSKVCDSDIDMVLEEPRSAVLENATQEMKSTIFQDSDSLKSLNYNTLQQYNNETVNQNFNLNKKNLSTQSLGDITTLLDNVSYRILGIGFPLLTIGILSGAVWANEAWGSYWSWDPKETWAFITWLIFAIYLHTRITKGWTGKKPAIIASLGFLIVWICYLGVNLLGKGLHSYGWFESSL